MLQNIAENHFNDENGNPAGGASSGIGISIEWQNGPLLKDGVRVEQNGAFVEGVISAAIGRLEYYQSSKFRCRENAIAITKLQEALQWLQWRTMERERMGIEGSHAQRPSEG